MDPTDDPTVAVQKPNQPKNEPKQGSPDFGNPAGGGNPYGRDRPAFSGREHDSPALDGPPRDNRGYDFARGGHESSRGGYSSGRGK